MRIHRICPVCRSAIDVKVMDFVPSRFWKEFQCPQCHKWLTIGIWARTLFCAVSMGMVVPLVVLATWIDHSGMLIWKLFQSDDGKKLGFIIVGAIMVSVAVFGMWCGAFAVGKIAKLKKADSTPPWAR